MKKLLGILVLGLLLNGNAFSKTISGYEDLDLTSKPKKVLSKSKTNSIYVISCPGGGDRFGTIEQPSTYFIEIATNTVVYVNKFPEYAKSDFIINKYRGTFNNKYRNQLLRFEPSELFTPHPMLITK